MGGPEISITSRLADDKFAEHARWVGIIIANWSILESEMEGIYGAVLGLDYDRSKIAFYAVQNFRAKRDIISATISELHKKTDIEKMWTDIQADLKTASDARNRAAHAIWAENPKQKDLQMRATNVSGVYSRPRKRYSVNNLKQDAELISRVAGALNQIQLAIRLGQEP